MLAQVFSIFNEIHLKIVKEKKELPLKKGGIDFIFILDKELLLQNTLIIMLKGEAGYSNLLLPFLAKSRNYLWSKKTTGSFPILVCGYVTASFQILHNAFL